MNVLHYATNSFIAEEIMDNKIRCEWCLGDDLMMKYHDEVWGVPVYDDRQLFAKLILDGAQAGLSWRTILYKQDNYYEAFDGFDPEKIARYDEEKIAELLQNTGIIRNRLKVQSAVKNAKGYLKIKEEHGSFCDFLWQFVDGTPIQNSWKMMGDLPAETAESRAMSKALKQYGFNFVGPTICYAFMQAVGFCNDHVVDCFRYSECKDLARF
jgi:DNA-3-methyladenine glycosylase I